MAASRIPTKEELLAALHASGDETIAMLRALPPASLTRTRSAGGWTGKEIVAHLAAIEWTYPRLIDLARRAAAPEAGRQGAPGDGGAAPTASGGIDAYNARQVAKRAGAALDALIAEFARNRAATIAAVEAMDTPLLAVPIRAAGGMAGPLGEVMRWAAVDHVRGHVRDIASEA